MTNSRFPVVSGFRVTWDSSKPPGQRILNIFIENPSSSSENESEEVKRESSQFYRIITREYMAQVGVRWRYIFETV